MKQFYVQTGKAGEAMSTVAVESKHAPMRHHKLGLMWSASGYGKRIQWQDLKGYLPAEWVDVCHVASADTEQQSLYEAETGDFPTDQKRFVLGFLADHFA